MSVLVNYSGRLGNNILQYLMGKYIAHKFDLKLKTDPVGLNDDFEIRYDEGGRCLEEMIEVNDDNILEILSMDIIDKGVNLNGFFQKKAIFQNEDIVSFYKDSLVPKKIDNTSDLFIHVRLGDIEDTFNLPYEYYENQISKINYNDCFLTSDSIDHPIVKKLQTRFKNVQLFTGWSPSFIIRYGTNCNKLVLSAGSFSFCMGFFHKGDPTVYCINNEVMNQHFNITQWDGGMFSALVGKPGFNFYT